MDVKTALEKSGIGSITRDQLLEIVQNIIVETRELIRTKGINAQSTIMGKVMQKVRGKVDGKIVNDVVSTTLKKFLEERGNN